jgi:hypothetical protein
MAMVDNPVAYYFTYSCVAYSRRQEIAVDKINRF